MSNSTGAVAPSHGSFLIQSADGKETVELDLGTIMMSVNLKYVELLDVQIASQISDTMNRNFQLEVATEVMSVLREQKENGRYNSGEEIEVGGMTKTLDDWCKYLGFGLSYASGSDFDSTMDNNIDGIQSIIDNLNNDSETASLQLQNLTEKRSNALLQASNLMSSANDSSQSILRNF